MFDEALRIPKEKLLAPLTRSLRDVSPAAVTVAACLAGVGAAAAAGGGYTMSALTLWGANRLLDGLDGTIARQQGRESDRGAFLDIVLDHVVYAAIPLGLAFAHGAAAAYSTAALLLAAFYINGASWMYLAALLEKRVTGAAARGELTAVTMPRGLIEGMETAILFALFILLPHWLPELFLAMAGLVVLTAALRVAWGFRHLRDP